MNMENKHRAIFLSDLHLGSGRTYTVNLLNFLKKNPTKRLVLVGDIIDFSAWKKHGANFDQVELELLLWTFSQITSKELTIDWVMGNHEALIRPLLNYTMKRIGAVTFHSDSFNYISKNQDIITILHGDRDQLYKPGNPIWYTVGTLGYRVISQIEKICKTFNLPSIVSFLQSLPLSKNYLNIVKQHALAHCQKNGTDGIIYGHTHGADFDTIGGKMVVNLGCWTHRPNTALYETDRGCWEFVQVK